MQSVSPFERSSYLFQQYENSLGTEGKSLSDTEEEIKQKIEAWRNGSIDNGRFKPKSTEMGDQVNGPITYINMGNFTSAPPHKYGKYVDGTHDQAISGLMPLDLSGESLGSQDPEMVQKVAAFQGDFILSQEGQSVVDFGYKYKADPVGFWIQHFGFSKAVKWFEKYGSESLTKWMELHGDTPPSEWSKIQIN
jgi:hypothetical protein